MKESWPEKHPSPVPRQQFSRTRAKQSAELKTNELMRRFAGSRQRLAADRYRPAYHFVSPENELNDPNGLCCWQGLWHLFYQAYPADEFPAPADIPKRRQHWGHTVSEDLVHWRDLPYAIYPGIEKMCFSGGTVVEKDRVVAFYPGIEAGQMVAAARDPLLLNWEKIKGNPVMRPGEPMGDSCIWKEGATYFGLIGARCLVSSKNLVDWKVCNASFLAGAAVPIDDGSCPTFLPIGDKHILLLFSHGRGGQYLLGDYDRKNRQFTPYHHGRFNHGNVSPGGVHAPSGAADGTGGVVNILNINGGLYSEDWDQIMSLAQQLTLGPDKRLRIEPVAATASLRGRHQHIGETVMPANKEVVLKAIRGSCMELVAEIDPQESRWVQLNVLRSPDAEERTSITFYNYDRVLSHWYHARGCVCLDGSRSSNRPDVWLRPPETAVVERAAAPMPPLTLRVFIDRSVVEVFVNGTQYLAMRVYPGRKDSVGVSLRAQGGPAVLKSLHAWQMRSIWP
jgi:beta-fructofuranosidase